MISVTNSDKGSFTMKFSTRDRYALRLMVELAKDPAEVRAGDILRAVEGELTAIPCLASSVDCPHRSQCHTLDFWSGLNDLINKYVDGITLEQLRTMPEVPEEQESCE